MIVKPIQATEINLFAFTSRTTRGDDRRNGGIRKNCKAFSISKKYVDDSTLNPNGKVAKEGYKRRHTVRG